LEVITTIFSTPLDALYATEAANIISNLRSLQAASLMFYADSMDVTNTLPTNVNLIKHLKPYIDTPEKYDSGYYILAILDGEWWGGIDLAIVGGKRRIKEQLKTTARSVGLFGGPSLNAGGYVDQDIVWKRVR
jgi:hypothetical protein